MAREPEPDEPELLILPHTLPHRAHRERVVELLKAYARAGVLLSYVANPHISNRSLSTLKRYCSAEGIAFPDYVPRYMKPKKPKRWRNNKPPLVL